MRSKTDHTEFDSKWSFVSDQVIPSEWVSDKQLRDAGFQEMTYYAVSGMFPVRMAEAVFGFRNKIAYDLHTTI